jgi:DNA-binding PadR family transcriptional regulator
MSSAVDREIRVAFWKIHILHHAARHAVYGLWLLDELAEHGHRVSPGTLYPLLNRMEANGWLRSSSPGGSKSRRSYRITSAGREILGQLRAEIVELHEEVGRGKEPHHDHDSPARRARSRGRRSG